MTLAPGRVADLLQLVSILPRETQLQKLEPPGRQQQESVSPGPELVVLQHRRQLGDEVLQMKACLPTGHQMDSL